MRSLLYIVILLVVTGCGCSGTMPRELDEAGNLMHSDPSAALSRLNAMDVSEFRDSATMARWALLHSEAMVVNRLSAPTDTIVNIAIDYYGRHNLTDEFRKATRLKSLMESSSAAATRSRRLSIFRRRRNFSFTGSGPGAGRSCSSV